MLTQYQASTLGLLTIVVQVILPLVVAAVTRTSGSVRVKSIILLALTALTQFVSAWIENFDNFDVRLYALNVVIGFVIAVATHYGLWKPTGAAESASRIGLQ